MNVNSRIRRYHQNRQRQSQKPVIPPWAELVKLDTVEVEKLAGDLGIAFEDRLSTLSAIHHSRG